MSFDPEFLSLMSSEITVEPFSSLDGWGNTTYGPAVSYQCRIVQKRRQILNIKGAVVLSETTIYVATTDQINIEDRITLPSEYAFRQPSILRVSRETDEEALHHTVVYC